MITLKNYSIWLDDINEDKLEELNKDISVDVLIIGGGITGISVAYELSKSNLNVTLVEKNRIGHGVTARTTGKLTFLQENIYSKLNKTYGINTAKLYLKSQQEAISNVKNIIKQENIDCSFNEVSSYIFTNSNSDISKIKEEKIILEKMGIKVKEENKLPDNTNISYGISTPNTAVFHPLKYVTALKNICLKKNINIYENTKIIDIAKDNGFYICKTDKNTVKAKKVILALHYPYFLIPYFFPFKTTLEKSYIAAYKSNKNLYFSSITVSKPTISTRYLDKNQNVYKLYLSKSHNLAFKNNDVNNFQELIKQYGKNSVFLWSNKDVITSDNLPFIGEIKQNLYIATGYNTWGMTNGTLAGKILSDLIQGKNNPYQELFNPKRGFNKNILIKFPVTLASTIKSFVGSKINKNKSWYNSNVKFIKKNGQNLGIYTDDAGNKHIVYNTCPHLKCSLVFNQIEKTWDCPCHGSRFDIDGHSIEGPSNYNINYKE